MFEGMTVSAHLVMGVWQVEIREWMTSADGESFQSDRWHTEVDGADVGAHSTAPDLLWAIFWAADALQQTAPHASTGRTTSGGENTISESGPGRK